MPILAVAAACTDSFEGTEDAGVVPDAAPDCAACQDAVQLRILGVDDPDAIRIDGVSADELVCERSGSFVYCGIRSLPPGEYTLTVRAAGFVPLDVFFTLNLAIERDGCDPCQVPFTRLLTLLPE